MNTRTLSLLLTLTAAAVLAAKPVLWLWRTWHDTTFLNVGGLIAVAVACLFVWSVTSTRQTQHSNQHLVAWGLLLTSALVRLTSQILGINVIGAGTLVIDIYAIAMLCGLHQRARAVSPGWLAILFALSLPVERILQRLIGYPLQEFAASLACKVLALGNQPVSCHGIDLNIAGNNVLVDLPCAGTAALHTIMVLFTLTATLRRPTASMAAIGIMLAIIAALAGNVVRIVLLAIGIAWPSMFANIDVMAAPWHEAIGVFTTAIPVGIVMLWARWVTQAGTRSTKTSFRLDQVVVALETIPTTKFSSLSRPFASVFMVLIAIGIVSIPARPLDVSRPMQPVELPRWLNGHTIEPLGLSPLEQQYFSQYGGAVARAAYGNQVLLVVRTSSPLRHIHSPEDCLRGVGHQVRYQGQTRGALPSAIYRTTDPAGRHWRVSVSYISADNDRVTSVGHAAWLWLKTPGVTWTMVQRISPWNDETGATQTFDHAVSSSLETTLINQT